MKIKVKQIPVGGVVLEEEINPDELDLATDIVKFSSPLKVKAQALRITNALTVKLELSAKAYSECSRCLNKLEIGFQKNLQFNCPLEKNDEVIDLDPDIRQEIIIDYPIKPLCSLKCKGLCPRCGKNLNEGGCSCAIT